MRYDVFLSHSSRDAPIANDLCARLEAAGVRCWIAPRDVHGGAEWADEIVAAIAQAPTLVVLLSAHSIASRQVLNEVTEAGRTGAVLVPLRLADVPLPNALRLLLGPSHWIDAFGGVAPHVPALVETARAARRAYDARTPGRADALPLPVMPPVAPPTARLTGFRPRTVLAAAAIAIAVPAAAWMALRPSATDAPPAGDRVAAMTDATTATVVTAAGITLSVTPDTMWAIDRAAGPQVLLLRHRGADLRVLAGVDLDAVASPAAFARAWLQRFEARLPIPVTAGDVDAVSATEWDVPLFPVAPASDTSGASVGVLRLLRLTADGRVLVRWWAFVGATPDASAPHEAEVGALIAAFRFDAAEPSATAP